jgi:hypothetical protein
MDHFISMYIDNELSLDEKILFLKHVQGNKRYTEEAVSLLRQEKDLAALFAKPVPDCAPPPLQKQSPARVIAWAAAACLLLVLSFGAGTRLPLLQPFDTRLTAPTTAETAQVSYRRFVIYQKESNSVEISGSFTNWERVSLLPTGPDGYWEVVLAVPLGEHRYSFIVDNSTRLPDPTVSAKEADDFGTFNSVITVGTAI